MWGGSKSIGGTKLQVLDGALTSSMFVGECFRFKIVCMLCLVFHFRL